MGRGAGAPPVRHLLIATSLPVFVPGGVHGLQQWNEAVCAGAWGRWRDGSARGCVANSISRTGRRSAISFDRFVRLLRDVATPDRSDGSEPPATVSVISGDVHFTYGVEVRFPPLAGRPEPTSRGAPAGVLADPQRAGPTASDW